MYVKVRKIGAKPGENDLTINISKKSKIEELMGMIEKELGIKSDQQILLYKGKQVSNSIFKYPLPLDEFLVSC